MTVRVSPAATARQIVLDVQIEKTVDGNVGQHMVQKADSCRYFMLPRAIQVEAYCDIGFMRLTGYGSRSHSSLIA